MTRIAASIECETIPRPAGLPDDMQPLHGAWLQFLSIRALDGFKVEAALWQPENKPPSDTTMIVQVHGSGGNLASFPLRATARALSPDGYSRVPRRATLRQQPGVSTKCSSIFEDPLV